MDWVTLTERLLTVNSVGVITGAGISAESGIPTYRGKGGIYDDPEEGERTVEALTQHVLESDPDRTWRAIAGIADYAYGADPNAGHRALVQIEDAVEQFVLLTQNVDGLHKAAGSRNIIHIHGCVDTSRCSTCGWTVPTPDLRELSAAPTCERCSAVLHPNVVLFGGMLGTTAVQQLEQQFFHQIPDLILVVGTTGMFPYIAAPAQLAQRAGRLVVEVNPEVTDLSGYAEFTIRAPAGVALPRIADILTSRCH